MRGGRRNAASVIVCATPSLLILLTSSCAVKGDAMLVSLVCDGAPGPAALHGLGKVRSSLQARSIPVEDATSPGAARGGVLIVSGVAGVAGGDGPAAMMHEGLGVAAPEGAESLVIHKAEWRGKKTLLVSGTDDRGLMYALLDVADRIGWSTDAVDSLKEVRDARESPAVVERALSKYTMHRASPITSKLRKCFFLMEQPRSTFISTTPKHQLLVFIVAYI